MTDDQRQRYFVQAADIKELGERVPDTSGGNFVEYLIDGDAYFTAIKEEIDALLVGGTDRFFYFTDWHLGLVQGPTSITTDPGMILSAWTRDANLSSVQPFDLDGASGPASTLIDQLAQMSGSGVDVRALVWASPILVEYKQAASQLNSYWQTNVHSLLSVHALRQRDGMANKVVLNTLAHPTGSMHLKMIICGNSVSMRAYVSGLDLVSSRHGQPVHASPLKKWHDVGVKVEGPATYAIYNHYKLLWNEQIKRPIKTLRVSGHNIVTHTDATQEVQTRTVSGMTASGPHFVQVLRTVPKMKVGVFGNVAPVNCFVRIFTGFVQKELSFAENGIFEFSVAIFKAISVAERYIYIEDQCFYSVPVMKAINARLADAPNLKVILLYGADPTDPPNEFLPNAIDVLLKNIPNPRDRVAFYRRGTNVVVHGKVTIIDDVWAAVGSANCMRRSLYTDGELSISVMEPPQGGAPTSFAQQLRKDLWGEHCGHNPGPGNDPLLDINAALGLWNPAWATPPTGFALLPSPQLERMNLPFEFVEPPNIAQQGQWGIRKPVFNPERYDLYDSDSRNKEI
jgi:phosphatidylserine/phosphatidylglycerophosphate/cardiolipin synthase-like enzyme